MGVQHQAKPIGAMGLKNITESDAEYWGYIGEKSCWGQGIGRFMLSQAKQKAAELQLQTIYLKVAESNTRAIALYEKEGFVLKESAPIAVYQLHL